MHPILLNFKFPIYTYGTLVAIAFLLGMKIAVDRAARHGIERDLVMNLSLVVMASSIFGARLLYVGENWGYFQDHLSETWKLHRGGLSYFGGFVFAIAASAIAIRRADKKFLPVVDLFMPSLALGQAIGRLGCYFNGCCYGIISKGFWGVMFPKGSAVFSEQVERGWIPFFWKYSLPVVPAQLLSSFVDILLFCALIVVDNRKKIPGTTFFTYLAGYGAARLCTEYLRADSPRMTLGWTLPQWISIAGVVAGITGLILLTTRRPLGDGNARPAL